MKWAAGIIFFNDKAGLKRCIDSIYENIDYVFCIDGKFKDFQAPHDLSTDGSRKIVQKYPNTILADVFEERQPIKRNKYFQLAGEHDIDILLIIDSDEYVIGHINVFKRKVETIILSMGIKPAIFNVPIRNLRKGTSYTYQKGRLCYKPAFLRMHPICHYITIDNSKTPSQFLRARTFVEGIVILHDDTLRTKEWCERMFNYQKKQILYELQWHLRSEKIIDNHRKCHGYENLDKLLEEHPKLRKIMNSYTIKEVEKPSNGYLANPEFAEYVPELVKYIKKKSV